MSRDTGNYEEARKNGAEYFLKMLEEGEISMRPDDDGIFSLRILDTDYEISSSDGKVMNKREAAEAGFSESLLCYDIIMNDDGSVRPSNDYVLLKSLSSIQNASTAFAGKGMFRKYEERCGGHAGELRDACVKLGGMNFGKADVSYLIPFYKGMFMVFEFWEADEDFPPQINFLFDRNILSYMHYEACWYLAGLAVNRITSLAGLSQKTE